MNTDDFNTRLRASVVSVRNSALHNGGGAPIDLDRLDAVERFLETATAEELREIEEVTTAAERELLQEANNKTAYSRTAESYRILRIVLPPAEGREHGPATTTAPPPKAAEPPAGAHYALYFFAPANTRDNIIGDLVEKYREVMLPTFGRRRADFWFRSQVIRSAFTMAPSRLLKFFTLRWLYDWVRHALIGS